MPLSEKLAHLVNSEGRKEIVSYTPLENLFVLVHPLNEEYGKGILCNNHTRRARRQFYFNALRDFVPKTSKDALVVIPDTDPTPSAFRKKVLATEIQMQLFNDPYSWITLYEEAEKEAVAPQNIMFGENAPEISIRSEAVEERLRGRGFSIASDTKITIGGELVENCIADTAMDFLSLAQVPYVLIDRRVSIGISEYAKHGPIPQTSDFTSAERLTILGYGVTPIGDRYLKVIRP